MYVLIVFMPFVNIAISPHALDRLRTVRDERQLGSYGLAIEFLIDAFEVEHGKFGGD